MTETPMGGPSDRDNWLRTSDVAHAVVAMNRYVGSGKTGPFPDAAIQYLMGAEKNDAELAHRLKVIGAVSLSAKKGGQPPPLTTAMPDGEKPERPARAPEEIAEGIRKHSGDTVVPVWGKAYRVMACRARTPRPGSFLFGAA